MFIDKAVVRVTAGTGGSGASSFARFKYKPKGGPDGGDGGRGGSIWVRADGNLATLLDYRYRTHWKAERGGHGKGKTMTGASRDDIELPVPPGTIIRDTLTGEVLGEVLREGDRLLVARGGRGGRGNARFASPTHRAPREWEPGEEGEERELELELKMIADVGLVGEPNAGKSTLLSVLSAARPKIADFPFTTLEPNLGVVGLGPSRSFVMADIPGIIEGAHAGKGLGLQFLRHVERTRLLLFMVPLDAPDPQGVFDQLRAEIEAYSPVLAAKPHALLLSKRDLLPEGDDVPTVHAPDALGVLVASSAAGSGLEELKEFLWVQIEAARADERAADAATPREGGTAPVHELFADSDGPHGTVETVEDGGAWDAPLPWESATDKYDDADDDDADDTDELSEDDEGPEFVYVMEDEDDDADDADAPDAVADADPPVADEPPPPRGRKDAGPDDHRLPPRSRRSPRR
jgi:GTP-binding protein